MARRAIIESPFAGDVCANLAYARACLRDSLIRGEAPFGSHLLYTLEGVLDDRNPAERAIGLEAGLARGQVAAATVVYVDLGVSAGMRAGVDRARRAGRPVFYRSLHGVCSRCGSAGTPTSEGLACQNDSCAATSRRFA
jgi:hypothetical protein